MRDTFRVRLNCVDTYQTTPGELDPPLWGNTSSSTQKRKQNLPQIPIIRVFGATETGQKVCMHIHGAFPYLYVEYNGSLSRGEVDRNIANLKLSIDHALALSYRRDPYDGRSNYVAYISIVKGVPFFGYTVGYKYFLKVYLLNPVHKTRLADLLLQGAIMKRIFQPYERHLEYVPQWMCDFNLYGCTYIETDKPHFRTPVPDYMDLESAVHKWHDKSIPDSQILDADAFPRQSHCSLELDICVEDILNRHDIEQRHLHQDFIERFQHLAPEEKLVPSMAGLWKDETKRRKRQMGMSDPGSSPFPPEVLVSMSADSRNVDKGGWIHEEEFRQTIEELVKNERENEGHSLDFDSFVKPVPEPFPVQTTFESIEELFLENLRNPLSGHLATPPDDVFDQGFGREPAFIDGSGILEVKKEDEHRDHSDDEEEARVLTESFTQIQETKSAKNHNIIPKKWKGLEVRANTLKESPLHYKEPTTGGQVNFHARRDIDTDEAPPDGIDYGLSFVDPHDIPLRNATAIQNPSESESKIDDAKVPQQTIDAIEYGGATKRAVTDDVTPMKRRKVVGFTPSTADRVMRPPFRPKPRVKDLTKGDQLLNALDSDIIEDQQLSQNLPPASNQDSPSQMPPSRNFAFSFPVVKNPHDPDTKLRLSQRNDLPGQRKPITPHKSSQFRSSQTSPRTPWTNTTSTNANTPSKAQAIPTKMRKCADKYTKYFPKKKVLVFGQMPPTSSEVVATMTDEDRPPVIYQNAYYSNEEDVPDRAREYAGQEFKLESNTIPYLPDFDATGESLASEGQRQPIVLNKTVIDLARQRRRKQCTIKRWEVTARPPSYAEVEEWLKQDRSAETDDQGGPEVDSPSSQVKKKNHIAHDLSQIDGPTQKNKHGFKFSQRKSSTSVQHETQYMSTMSLEVHVNSRGDLAPDPEHDEISCIFWCLQSDDDGQVGNVADDGKRTGMILLSPDGALAARIRKQCKVDELEEEDNELDVINRLVDIVRGFDPDILTGYEVHNNSWGYIIERARLKFEFDLCNELSRMKSQSHSRFGKDADRWGFEHTSTVRVTGRHMINIWRAMRGELNLLQYTLENVVFHLLHRRVHHYAYADLTRFYQSPRPRMLAKTLDYYLTRVHLDLEIIDANELIPRTSEQARLLGVDFFSVFSRGSQFKVESLMFRIAKPENFILVSPSRLQVGRQNALECLPLVMEPQSQFYNSPLLVLDFQSLYPSVMIAYNYCYSTCLGRIVSWRGTNKMGFKDFKREAGLLELVKDKVNISPNGMMYVKTEMRKSLLAKMLSEILETRVMVKSGMKADKDDKTLQQLLNNRQLALKLIANVTYGYTSASFSGRMPCSEIADSIVQTGRETLEKAIALIHSVERWGAEVVYGDTDSLFVYLKGRTRADAFVIGNEISKAITDMNPRPVKLKFEKVYHPCVLIAKKRYVGFKYEHPNQTEPEWDAKGIETVRRDGTPAEQKIEETALKMLFRTADLSQIKAYFQAQCKKIMTGKFSVQDFCFAKEVKLGTYSDKAPAPPGALISTKRMLRDPRLEPQYGERVPYVVIAGAPKEPLYSRCVEPERLLYDEHAELDAEYYISKNIIPPLERIFNLVGANVRAWFDEMPKVQKLRSLAGADKSGHAPRHGFFGADKSRKTMEAYMSSSSCINCRTKLPLLPRLLPDQDVPLPLCPRCSTNAANTLLSLRRRLQAAERKKRDLETVCRSCAGLAADEDVRCDSRDCGVFYSRIKAETGLGVERGRVGDVVAEVERREALKMRFDW
ncbi:hypothetical protein BDV97DRAFT_362890 [Delphinella strobiligena]|nr:hypothetical protein BDV97DRAFT_362890 [Delphinella strobiligena]